MALYRCCGGGATLYTLCTLTKTSDNLWQDDGTTYNFTLTASKSVELTVIVTSSQTHEETITVDDASFTNGGTIAAGTHTIKVRITGRHVGTVKTGTLSITGKSTAMPVLTMFL